MNGQRLDITLDTLKSPMIFGANYFKDLVPEYVYDNLRSGFGRREYQQEAFGRFVHYWTKKEANSSSQLLFHMATGSGKTLIMAGLMLYLYDKGYRNFLFFVNSTNIIQKTKDNFLNHLSSKYLFADEVKIEHKHIRIKEVDNFQGANEDDINIVFSTIQGLHYDLNNPKENSLTYDDFEDKEIVLISDEAHHINTMTRVQADLSADEVMDLISWENTVNKIFQANTNNFLLEFTATADLHNDAISAKYKDKLLFDYPLKQFRDDGYSKDVKTLQAELDEFGRSLQALVLSQYRRKVFEKHRIFIKPVILFKSRVIQDSKDFHEEFHEKLEALTSNELEEIKNYAIRYATSQEGLFSKTPRALFDAFMFFEKNGISLENLVLELQEDFGREKSLSVNSKEESEERQIAVNTLEDESNEYRAIFAVNKLNEGWDVLNLFDIVRLYDTRDAKQGKPGKTTMSEAQLIGRGARYCPFQLNDEQPLYQRKYDLRTNDDEENELKVCEELYYHSKYNPKYIQELNTALVEIGIKAKETTEIDLKLKPDFAASDFFQTSFVFANKRIKDDREDVFGLKTEITEHIYKTSLDTGFSQTGTLMAEAPVGTATIKRKHKDFKLVEFGDNLVRKALNQFEFYKFSNLQGYLPNLESISEFITSDKYLGKVKIEVSGTEEQIANLSKTEMLKIAVGVLNEVEPRIVSDKIEFRGTERFEHYLLKDVVKEKTLNLFMDEGSDRQLGRSMNDVANPFYLDLSRRDWYVFEDCFGTSEEKLFIKYLDKIVQKLNEKYDQIYLVRNERYLKIYNFEDGRAIEPDFLLFLTKQEPETAMHYQIFIEPKGNHLLETDKWKEDFLKAIKEKHQVDKIWQGKSHVVWGLPFFNQDNRLAQFDEAFKTELL